VNPLDDPSHALKRQEKTEFNGRFLTEGSEGSEGRILKTEASVPV
jgi:hypothetical protein